MPKELIQRPSDPTAGTCSELSLHWQRDNWVQIGLTRHVWQPQDPEALCSAIHGEHTACEECARAKRYLEQQRLVMAGQPQAFTAMTSSDAPPVGDLDDPVTVFTDVMSRDQINNMIRALRRARDQAYGQDA